jgi:hypothetical protein
VTERTYRPTTLLDWQEALDEAIRGCLSAGMSVEDVAEWVSDTLRDEADN